MDAARRFPAMLLALLLCAVLLFSLLFIALEADHDCTGEDCAVCSLLSLCGQLLQSVLRAAVTALFAAGAAAVFPCRARPAAGAATVTPISLRVKLSD